MYFYCSLEKKDLDLGKEPEKHKIFINWEMIWSLVKNYSKIRISERLVRRSITVKNLPGRSNGYVRWYVFLDGRWRSTRDKINSLLEDFMIVFFLLCWFYYCRKLTMIRILSSRGLPDSISCKANLVSNVYLDYFVGGEKKQIIGWYIGR